MPFSNTVRNAFIEGGFTTLEIKRYEYDCDTRPMEIDPFSDAWQETFRKRIEYIKGLLHMGIKATRISDKIDSYLMGKSENSPYDYIREAYPIRGEKKSDFNARVEARAQTARNKIRRHFGKAYTETIF